MFRIEAYWNSMDVSFLLYLLRSSAIDMFLTKERRDRLCSSRKDLPFHCYCVFWNGLMILQNCDIHVNQWYELIFSVYYSFTAILIFLFSHQVVITKCYHLFCNTCVQRIVESRHRKCPVCSMSFGHNDVKPVYIWRKGNEVYLVVWSWLLLSNSGSNVAVCLYQNLNLWMPSGSCLFLC